MPSSSLLPGIQTRQTAALPIDPSLPNDTTAPKIIGISGFMAGFSLLIVLARCYVRVVMMKMFGVDDWIMLFAMACGITVLALFIVETQNGLGRYTQYILPGQPEILARVSFYHSIFVTVGNSAVKLSIGIFLLRVAERTKFRKFIMGMIGLFTVACTGTLIFQCRPIQASWDPTLKPTAKCYSVKAAQAVGLFNSSTIIATDVILATLPIFMFYKVKVNKRTRASLMGIFSLGYLSCAAGIVKTIPSIDPTDPVNPYRNNHFTIWNNVELNTGIIAGSLPSIKPLFKALFQTARTLTPNIRSRRSRRSRRSVPPLRTNKHNDTYPGTSTSNFALKSFASTKQQHTQHGRSHPPSNTHEDDEEHVRSAATTRVTLGSLSEASDIGSGSGSGSGDMPMFLDDRASPGTTIRMTELYACMDRVMGRSTEGDEEEGDVGVRREDGDEDGRSRPRPRTNDAIGYIGNV
ncbi:hypothetical protein FQN54_007600 [Arachnomyces sp. PD_36]|nr:hypothetical protein FQN54_007600 [Arachnomyces sp. PD_36]